MPTGRRRGLHPRALPHGRGTEGPSLPSHGSGKPQRPTRESLALEPGNARAWFHRGLALRGERRRERGGGGLLPLPRTRRQTGRRLERPGKEPLAAGQGQRKRSPPSPAPSTSARPSRMHGRVRARPSIPSEGTGRPRQPSGRCSTASPRIPPGRRRELVPGGEGTPEATRRHGGNQQGH